MNDKLALEIIDKIFMNVFNTKNNYSMEEILNNFAFDVKLPQKVYDCLTNEETWASSINPINFITLKNMEQRDISSGWMLDKKNVESLEELINIWKSINMFTTERVYDSVDVVKSDPIYRCEKVYQSTDCRNCKNIVYCDGCANSEYLIASQRSASISFSIRVDDSNDCSNSYNVICSSKISNSLFIQDCFNLHECIFCSHISNKKYCISNMQFEKEEYFEIKKMIVKWILNRY